MRLTKTEQLVGKTIAACESCKGEYGRTWDAYLLLTFTDGDKAMVPCVSSLLNPHAPDPDAKDMAAAPAYFSSDDIADKVRREENSRRKRIRDERERDEWALAALKKKLGLDGGDK